MWTSCRSFITCGTWCLAWFCLSAGILSADEITYETEDGKKVTSQGRLLPSRPGVELLERWDGQIQPLDPSQIIERNNTGDVVPITPAQMGERLEELFGKDLVRIEIQPPVVVAIVLAGPLQPKAEAAAKTFLQKAMRFMQNVDDVFDRYARQMEFPLHDAPYPVVLLIFESDQDFEDYFTTTSGGKGLSAGSVLGFYSQLTNRLAVRMTSCDSFAVPLHEAIHQQISNRVLHRLAPIPRWFAEGIANAFEGNGDKIDTNPGKVNADYVRRAQAVPRDAPWSKVVGDDGAFLADVLAGDAYTLAWCLHWTASTQYKDGYKAYVQALAKRRPLEELPPFADDLLFEKSFGVSQNAMQAQFPDAVLTAARKQKVDLSPPPRRDEFEQKSLCQYFISATAISRPNGPATLKLTGSARNLCPFRDMTFYITVETEGGFYAEYLFADLKPRQMVKLPEGVRLLPIPGRPQGPSSRYSVFVRSVPADSPEAAKWKQGDVPGPVTGGR
ncbi:DUF1570 domain-containing protein [Planctomicrobium piriforme]|uniref:DUF1570 domain-containing protein n=1 Tax=Planctomicrobium piriforme TaxID=1576369 RepID=A0A1I3RU40_9PLAN|nr:DUF1570 domain-containing protein [Planctomicrobium piriforme]SFJ48726.1 Protein of unknown function [Planctomicrobium piriforme]